MKTSELREIAGFYGCDGRTRWLAAEVIRLRETLEDMRDGISAAFESGD